MRNIIIFASLIVIAVVTTALTRQPQAWEYKFDTKCTEKRANDFTAQGWELTHVTESVNSYGSNVLSTPTCIYRRSK
jgi:hypothetical protein